MLDVPFFKRMNIALKSKTRTMNQLNLESLTKWGPLSPSNFTIETMKKLALTLVIKYFCL